VSYIPTPEEIAEKCKRLQRRWTEAERQGRAGVNARQDVGEIPCYSMRVQSGKVVENVPTER